MINSCAVARFTDHLLYRAKTRLCFQECERRPILGRWGNLAKMIVYLHIKTRMHAATLKMTQLCSHQIKC